MTWQPIGVGRGPTRVSIDGANLDGVWWFDAPLPRRWHRCKPQTRGMIDGRRIERCACGAIRIDGGGWSERNSRRSRNQLLVLRGKRASHHVLQYLTSDPATDAPEPPGSPNRKMEP